MEIRGIELGPFELVRPLGDSHAGEVYMGLYGSLAVAVKVYTDDRARRCAPLIARAARRAATLAHPGIAVLLDYGLIPAAAHEQSEGRLPKGSPYVVTELGRGPVWHDPNRSWSTIRRLLLRVLDALAYAHARGVFHRAVQTSNIVAFPESGPKLVDFCTTGALEGTRVEGPAGNPAFQAPEHLASAARDIGPWTDLYALGCVAWEQVVGAPPFQADDARGWRQVHRLAAPPPLEPVMHVPPGLEAWLRKLLAKDPADRFVRAADAAWALLAMEPNDGIGSAVVTLAPLLEAGPRPDRPVPTPPPGWTPETPATEPRLLAAGLALHGLRRPNLVGRSEVRDALWNAFLDTARASRPGLVLLRGPAGAGKSRLARWLVERCHELGAGTSLAAVHGIPRGPWDGVQSAIEHRLRCRGLSRPAVEARIRRRFPTPELQAAAMHLLRPDGTPVPAPHDDRIGAMVAVLDHLRDSRPLVLWLDDAHWAPEALALTERILASDLPMLVCLTARDASLARLPDRGARLRAVAAHPRARTLELLPMERGEPAQLVGQLLGVPAQVASQVDGHTHGNPLFAEQLACDWVSRQLVFQGRGQLEHDDATTPPSYASLANLWEGRLKDFLARYSHGSRLALEIAAVLGRRVRDEEWKAVCAKAGVRRHPGLVPALERARLVHRHGTSWSFDHNSLVETLLEQARATRRLTRHRTRVASVLLANGRALLDQGKPLPASELLYRALQLAEDDRSGWARVLVVLAESQVALGRLDDAGVGLETALDIHRSDGDRTFEGLTLSLLGAVCHARGEDGEARAHWQEALKLFSELNYALGLGRVLDQLAALDAEDDPGRARALLARAVEAHHEVGELARQASTLLALARLEAQDDLLADARAHLLEAHELARHVGSAALELEVLEQLGNMLVARGNLTEGLRWLRAGLRIAREAGHLVAESRLLADLARAEQQAGSPEGAAELLSQAQQLLGRLGERALAARMRAGQGQLLARRGEIARAIETLERAATEHDGAGDPGAAANDRCLLADLHRLQGRLDEAHTIYDQALAIAQEQGLMGTEARALRGLGELARLSGDTASAEASLRTASALFAVEGLLTLEVETLISLGDVLREAGSLVDAEEALVDARERSHDLDDQALKAEVLSALANLQADCDNEAAADTLVLAMAALPESASPLSTAMVNVRRARVAMHLGESDETWSALTVATRIAVKLDVRPESYLARTLDELTRAARPQAERVPRSLS